MKKIYNYVRAAFILLLIWIAPIVLGWFFWFSIESWISWQTQFSPGEWGWFGRIIFGACSVGWTILLGAALIFHVELDEMAKKAQEKETALNNLRKSVGAALEESKRKNDLH